MQGTAYTSTAAERGVCLPTAVRILGRPSNATGLFCFEVGGGVPAFTLLFHFILPQKLLSHTLFLNLSIGPKSGCCCREMQTVCSEGFTNSMSVVVCGSSFRYSSKSVRLCLLVPKNVPRNLGTDQTQHFKITLLKTDL